MKNRLVGQTVIAGVASMSALLAQAHTGAGEPAGFSHGFAHPFGGVDHLLAMIAVGVWAAGRGGRDLWRLPATFLAAMAAGAWASAAGLSFPFAEAGVALSLLLLAGLVVTGRRLPVAASIGLIALFAAFHGHVHGSEMPAGTLAFAYASGFLGATALLHGLGIALFLLARDVRSHCVDRRRMIGVR